MASLTRMANRLAGSDGLVRGDGAPVILDKQPWCWGMSFAMTLNADPLLDPHEKALLARIATAPTPLDKTRLLVAISDYRISYGDILRAEKALHEAEAFTPQNRDLILRRCRLLNQLGNWRASLALLEDLDQSARTAAPFWLCLADTYRQGRLWDKVDGAARNGLGLNPSSEGLLLLYACARAYAEDWSEASRIFKALAPKPEAYEMYATAQAHGGQIQDALATLEVALSQLPSHARLINAFCMLKWMSGDQVGFATYALTASARYPSDIGLVLTAADLLRRAGRVDEALAILTQAHKRFNAPELTSALALLNALTGNLDLACQQALASVKAAPRVEWIRRNCAVVLLTAGDSAAAAEHCQWGLNRNQFDQEWIAVDSVVKRLAGDEEYLRTNDYARLVRAIDIDFETHQDGEQIELEAFCDYVRSLHAYSRHPLDQSLREGTQLPLEPKDRQAPLIAAFFEAIKPAILDYLKDAGNDASHPFTQRNTGDYDISGAWSVRLREGGKHVNHIHPEGWLSAVFYLKVPDPALGLKEGEGDLCFGQPNFDVKDLKPDYKVTPKAGRLVLFPSFMWHGTIPLSQDVERITISFDLVPIPAQAAS